ncbi:MAG: hypothetical protein OXP37_03790 [Chloroflexota bacterium]|nr:hypothetical protein [Chloroflexota bacterium]
MRKPGPRRQSGSDHGGPGPALVRILSEAADLNCGVASVDEADLGVDLLPVLGRELALAVAGNLGANTLTVRIDSATESIDPAALGADELRRIVRVDELPDFGPPPAGYSCLPVNAQALGEFLEFFAQVFAPGDLGLADGTALSRTAGQLHRGRPIQGRGDYQGRIVVAGSEPVGLFFLAGRGAVRELGFMGAAPRLRRRFGLRGALATGVAWIRGNGISALTAEIAVQNSTSLAMAGRLRARATGLRAVYLTDPARTP